MEGEWKMNGNEPHQGEVCTRQDNNKTLPKLGDFPQKEKKATRWGKKRQKLKDKEARNKTYVSVWK